MTGSWALQGGGKVGLATEHVRQQMDGTQQCQHPEPRGWICFV